MNKDQPSKQNKPGLGASRERSDAEVLRKLAGVRLLSLDVDGVMTDGGLYYTDDGHISRKFNVKDGVGIKRAMDAGIQIVIISAGVSGSVPERAETLGIEHVFTGVEDKRAVLETLCDELGIGLDEVLARFAALPDLDVPDGVDAALGDDGFRIALTGRWNGYRAD